MKRCRLWATLALLFCTVAVIVLAPSFSLAYITSNSNTLHNTFRVSFLPPQEIRVPVQIEKVLINMTGKKIGLDGFEFHLTNVDTGEVTVLTSDENGWAGMNLIFTGEDVGKTFHYRLSERNTKRKYMIYDDKVYDIQIALRLNDIHEISVDMMVDGKAVGEIKAKFVNMYYVPVPLPNTGGGPKPVLWTVLLVLSGAGLVVLGIKLRKIFRRP